MGQNLPIGLSLLNFRFQGDSVAKLFDWENLRFGRCGADVVGVILLGC